MQHIYSILFFEISPTETLRLEVRELHQPPHDVEDPDDVVAGWTAPQKDHLPTPPAFERDPKVIGPGSDTSPAPFTFYEMLVDEFIWDTFTVNTNVYATANNGELFSTHLCMTCLISSEPLLVLIFFSAHRTLMFLSLFMSCEMSLHCPAFPGAKATGFTLEALGVLCLLTIFLMLRHAFAVI